MPRPVRLNTTALAGVLAVAATLAGCDGQLPRLPGRSAAEPPVRISDAVPAPALPGSARNVIVDAVEKVGPAVVRIDAT